MKVVTSNQMRMIQSKDINDRRYSYDDFVVLVAIALQNKIMYDKAPEVVIVCGNNDNGNYGFSLASMLISNTNVKVRVIYNGSKDNRYYQMTQANGIEIIDNQRVMRQVLNSTGYIVDCLYGIELNEMISYPENYLIQWINESPAYVLSTDVPSGLDCNDGSIYGSCVCASATLTIQLPKVGLYLKPGCDYVGQLYVEPIGLSYDAIESVSTAIYTNELSDIRLMLPTRGGYEDSYSYGRVILCSNDSDSTGSNLITSKALLQSGCSYLTVASLKDTIDVFHNNLYEASTITFPIDQLRKSIDSINYEEYDLILLKQQKACDNHLLSVALKSSRPVIIDQNDLGFLYDNKDCLDRDGMTVIVATAEQFNKLFAYQPSTLLDDLKQLTLKYPKTVLVYKSEYTMVVYNGMININTVGNNSLAKNGVDDVLTGLMAGLLVQKVNVRSIIAAIYIHSLASDYWVKDHSHYSLNPASLMSKIDDILFSLTKK